MRFVCTRDHDYGSGPRPETVEGFWPFVLHTLTHWDAFRVWCCRVGFRDSHGERELSFWRWDFWNNERNQRIAEYERRQWEAKRAATRARWGDDAA